MCYTMCFYNIQILISTLSTHCPVSIKHYHYQHSDGWNDWAGCRWFLLFVMKLISIFHSAPRRVQQHCSVPAVATVVDLVQYRSG